jgi:DNA-binding MarR family transcriptional regulator
LQRLPIFFLVTNRAEGGSTVTQSDLVDEKEMAPEDYRALADWRYRIRQFLAFTERAARDAGLEPQQYQLLLMIKGLPPHLSPTISVLADRMAVRHHSMVELVDRLVDRGLVRRERGSADRREVMVILTAAAERVCRRISLKHHKQLKTSAPALIEALSNTLRAASFSDDNEPQAPSIDSPTTDPATAEALD